MNFVVIGLLLVPQLFAAAPPPADDRTFDGDYRYRNESNEKLWVEDVTGLMACGYLIPDCEKGVHEGRFRCPAEVVIKWKVRGKQGWKTQTLKLPRARRDAELIFQYTKEGKWEVFFEQKQKLYPRFDR